MSDTKARGAEVAQRLETLEPEEWESRNEASREQAKKAYGRFQDAFKKGQCFMCKQTLTHFDAAERPCLHWLLNPPGFRKEHFEKVANSYSMTTIEHYLRWVANEEAFAKNINDLADEGTGKLIELTIKYKNLSWGFSCGSGDFEGHDGAGEEAKVPHYHMQMYIDGLPLVRYNDFHLPLDAMEVGTIEYGRKHGGVKRRFSGGTGMGEVLDEDHLNQLVELGKSGETDEEIDGAPIHISTIMMAEPGKTISGEDIYNAIQAARRDKTTITSKLKLLGGASIKTMVSAGPGVIQQAPRSGGRKKKKKR